ncbi:MAG TPA: tRNA preQ1(34) S-adenosylmethionine ribosyltransferase-isomerase QueA [Opitutaceae bacterium]
MKTALFDYDLPAELIAQRPAAFRDASRLLVVDRRSKSVSHHVFSDLPAHLRSGDCLIRNKARVLPARLLARRVPGGGRVECLLLRPAGGPSMQWWCLLRPGRKLPPGTRFGLPGEFEAVVCEKSASAEYRVEFMPERTSESVVALAERLGRLPLPPYVERASLDAGGGPGPEAGDRERYQTVFADPAHTVAVAAPTAGLHFTDSLIANLVAGGVTFADVILHVGLGTFRPIESEEISEHPIHRERVEIPAATLSVLEQPCPGHRIAVGTTSLRTVEHYAMDRPGSRPPDADYRAEADLFVRPPYQFKLIDALITNFHLPRSTLLCLVAAFLTPGSTDGVAWWREIYAEALRERYRFLSYGDAMLIL